jgi:glucose uptake protein
VLGLFGGILWCVGAITSFVASSAPVEVKLGPAIGYALGEVATLIAAFWGLIMWKEFAGATGRVKRMLTIMFVLFACGLTLVSMGRLSDS